MAICSPRGQVRTAQERVGDQDKDPPLLRSSPSDHPFTPHLYILGALPAFVPPVQSPGMPFSCFFVWPRPTHSPSIISDSSPKLLSPCTSISQARETPVDSWGPQQPPPSEPLSLNMDTVCSSNCPSFPRPQL
jgi:hypothetical protein